ncbi:unnamed protein product [Larinioides sclopetarius]|uniref:Uncharacterized protein n=1 Tax=Larinioides sclopetarius TaxID=280406 RepID=A0AAV2AB47_9ARAC
MFDKHISKILLFCLWNYPTKNVPHTKMYHFEIVHLEKLISSI